MPETQRHAPPGADDLQRRRREIGRGLRRSHYAVLAASLMVGLLAVAAVWLSREAQHRAEDAQAAGQRVEVSAELSRQASTKLWQFALRAAVLERYSRKAGQRTASLSIIREAAVWRPSRELRDEALSALLLPDVGTNLVWHKETGFEYAAAYDVGFEHFIQNCDHGRAIVRRAADGAVLMDEPGLGPTTPFRQFSPDGRLAAIAFRGGQIGVWDWRTTNLVATFTAVDAPYDEPPFDFSADGRHLWLLATDKSLQEVAPEAGQRGAVIALEHVARLVRLSPSGRLAAVAGGQNLDVWDLVSRVRRATLALTNKIWRLAWQPGEERLAVGSDAGLFLWDIGAPEATRLRQGGSIRWLFFSADGDLLHSSGDGLIGQFWRVRDRQVLLQMDASAALELSRDQTRLSVAEGRVGYGMQQYLPPAGLRSWPAPPSLGKPRPSADVDPQERWLLMAYKGGWLLRDVESGRELARVPNENTLAASFSADGSNVLAWTRAGLQRWPLVEAPDSSTLAAGGPETVWSPAGGALDLAVFAAGRRYTSCSQTGRVTVLDLEHPGKPVQFGLQLAGDNSFCLSPDGRWLLTGYHNQHGVDWYDCRAGKWLRRFAESGYVSGVVFDPQQGRLFTCTSTEHCEWNPEDGRLLRTIPWRTPAPYQDFLAFGPGGGLALVKSSPSSFQLYDLQAGRDFATLDFRDPQAVFGSHWSRDGRRLFLFGHDGGVTRLDLAALRAELDRLGLNWSDEDPSREFAEPPAGAATAQTAPNAGVAAAAPAFGLVRPAKLIWLVSAGLVVTIGIGLYILRYQRRLFGSFLETETLAEQRANELRDTHAALAHSEKMKALGTMAAGVAHDFNNLLSVIRLSSELIEEQTQPEGTTKENFETIQHAVERGHGVVNSMLGYARDDGQARPFAPSALISDAVALLSKPFLSGLVLQIEVDPAAPELIGRKGRVEQMLLNLIVNAAEAMGACGTLRLAAREVTQANGCVLPPRAAARYVEISVADTGPGIAPEVLTRIFEPFFTTKTKGAQHGTGLGLSMLYTMAREDGMGVAVESEPGRGATFRLLLPVEPPTGATRPLPGGIATKQTGGHHA